jgi:hypothetical protein
MYEYILYSNVCIVFQKRNKIFAVSAILGGAKLLIYVYGVKFVEARLIKVAKNMYLKGHSH